MDKTSISSGICTVDMPCSIVRGILWSIIWDEHDFKVGRFQEDLVDGHNNLSLDGCEGDSGKGAKLGISLRAESRDVLGEVINNPVRFLLPY